MRIVRLVVTGVALLAGALAFAQEVATIDAVDQVPGIAPQPLNEALEEFADKSGLQLIYVAAVAHGKKSKGAEPDLSNTATLNQLLASTDLEYEFLNDNTVTVQAISGKERGESKSLSATSGRGGNSGTAGRPASPDGVVATVSGRVHDGRTNAGLASVLIRIVETGQTTKTDELGKFRFSSVPPGSYTLTASYLGFAETATHFELSRGEQFVRDITLGPTAETALDEIVVFGSRSARAQSLNRERLADNSSSVLSADFLGNFTGTTISDALRRAPGIAFVRNPANGEGTNIIVRGLEPDMNAVKLNGLHLPVGNGQDRSANLNNLLVDSIDKITIHKTLLPSHDNAGTGGLVEIETKSPLSRPRRYFNFSLEGGEKSGGFGDDFLASATVAGTFGAQQNIGLSVSAQYRERDDKSLNYFSAVNFGQYLPLEIDGTTAITNTNEVDPRLSFPFEAGVEDVYPSGGGLGSNVSSAKTQGLTLSAEWQVSPQTNLRLDYLHSKGDSSGVDSFGSANFNSNYVLRPVAALGGDERYALTFDGLANMIHRYDFGSGEDVTDNINFRGQTESGKWSINYALGYVHGSSDGESSDLNLGFNGGRQPLDNSFFLSQAVDPVEGLIISPFAVRSGNTFAAPLLSDSGWSFLNDPSNFNFQKAVVGSTRGENNRFTSELSAKYNLDQEHLKYLEVGVWYEESKNTSRFQSTQIAGEFAVDPDTGGIVQTTPSLEPFGMTFMPTDLTRIGQTGRGFNFLGNGGVRQFFADLDQFTSGTNPLLFATETLLHPNDDDRFTEEKSLAAYIQGRVDIGKLEIIGGVRMSRVEVRALTITTPEVQPNFFDFFQDFPAFFAARDELLLNFSTVLDSTATQTDFLPRVALNFRQSDNLIFRGGYYLTTARPSITQLSDQQFLFVNFTPFSGPDFNQASLEILQGNPGLKPATTDNFDLSIEYYHDQIGVMKLSAFYKDINNSLQSVDISGNTDISKVEFPDHPFFTGPDGILALVDSDAAVVVSRRPENSNSTTYIRGIEAQFERQFTFLPGIWNGFGVLANFAYTDSKAHKIGRWFSAPVLDANGNTIPIGTTGLIERELLEFELPNEKFNLSPSKSGTFALTYNKYDIDAALSYGFQDRYQRQFSPNNLDSYQEEVSTLDFRGSYYIDRGAGIRLFIEGTDLAKGNTSPDLETSNGGVGGLATYYRSAVYLGGRKIRVGFSASF